MFQHKLNEKLASQKIFKNTQVGIISTFSDTTDLLNTFGKFQTPSAVTPAKLQCNKCNSAKSAALSSA